MVKTNEDTRMVCLIQSEWNLTLALLLLSAFLPGIIVKRNDIRVKQMIYGKKCLLRALIDKHIMSSECLDSCILFS